MAKIIISTYINAPIELVYDNSRSIDLHIISSSNTKEKAIDGITSGLINLGETVTWRAKHLGFFFTHKSKITAMSQPYYFTDTMTKGAFLSFNHEHIFIPINKKNTLVIDIIDYRVPGYFIGMFFNFCILKRHLVKFIRKRNSFIKVYTESYNPSY